MAAAALGNTPATCAGNPFVFRGRCKGKAKPRPVPPATCFLSSRTVGSPLAVELYSILFRSDKRHPKTHVPVSSLDEPRRGAILLQALPRIKARMYLRRWPLHDGRQTLDCISLFTERSERKIDSFAGHNYCLVRRRRQCVDTVRQTFQTRGNRVAIFLFHLSANVTL